MLFISLLAQRNEPKKRHQGESPWTPLTAHRRRGVVMHARSRSATLSELDGSRRLKHAERVVLLRKIPSRARKKFVLLPPWPISTFCNSKTFGEARPRKKWLLTKPSPCGEGGEGRRPSRMGGSLLLVLGGPEMNFRLRADQSFSYSTAIRLSQGRSVQTVAFPLISRLRRQLPP